MKQALIITGVIILVLLPLLTFIYFFHESGISKIPNDWQIFAAYFSGTTGTIGSIIAGYFLYRTLVLQNNQRVEQLFFNYLNIFINFKEKIANDLIEKEIHLHEGVRHQIKGRQLDEETLKDIYVKMLKETLLEGYSIHKKTPRLKVLYNKYFEYIYTISSLFQSLKINRDQFEQLRSLLLVQFHDSELKMICYYFYLFYDIVNSANSDFTANNVVKKVGLFDGNLRFADDFSRNYDPRRNDFATALNAYKEEIKKMRKIEIVKKY